MPKRNIILEEEEANNELSADDLAIIAAGLTVLGDLFSFYSLIKEREETEKKLNKNKS
ncbi:hypothetical protein J2T12_000363 [Paenibacillus anaericanus]|uniref:hypothetical protein n=1 Tax=Paenibacillus anaericanus TaxID=170367 RepID=UPI00277FF960|nr:hypothetical protein [Paenibacillus anaericanus]MDQ0086969.1 hypothetical protein [Paenibacillus anaericanus]